MSAYYNEFDPYAAQWLRNLIEQDLIAPGDVDERSITDVQASDLESYTQCHFFAGIGGWSFAARLAGWADDRELWTGSCPCQPFSVAGKQAGQSDERHLWPTFASLIAAQRPSVVMGEQVAAAVGKHWLDGVHSDLEAIGYSVGAAVVPACAVDAPHRRDRLWFVADADSIGSGQKHQDAARRLDGSAAREVARSAGAGDVTLGNAIGAGLEGQRGHGDDRHQPGRIDPNQAGSTPEAGGIRRRNSTAWSGAEWLAGADGKARRFEPSIRLLAHGVPARVGKLRAYGNAIVPQLAAEVIAAYMEARP